MKNLLTVVDDLNVKKPLVVVSSVLFGQALWLISAQLANASEITGGNAIYEIGEIFELGIQLSYLLLLLGLLGVGTFFVIRQVLVRRELDLSAKELQVRICFPVEKNANFNALEIMIICLTFLNF